jgi:hypothetical protein
VNRWGEAHWLLGALIIAIAAGAVWGALMGGWGELLGATAIVFMVQAGVGWARYGRTS